MILRNCDIRQFVSLAKNRKVVCFGAGALLEDACSEFKTMGLEKYIAFIVDNNPGLWNTQKRLNDTNIDVLSPEALFTSQSDHTILLISCGGTNGISIYDQLLEMTELKNMECYFLVHLRANERNRLIYNDSAKAIARPNARHVIPKKIHYCWVGGNPMPKNNLKCIDSWKKHCSDYEIVQWNEHNYDFNKNAYMSEAYQAKRWGFVPDYARLDIIYTHGGIYLDTDVEIVAPFDDLLYNNAFAGFEDTKHVALGLGFGSAPKHPLIGELRESYKDLHFIHSDGSLNLTPAPVYQTDFLKRRGLRQDDSFQVLNGMSIYPTEYFSPFNPHTGVLQITPQTYSIHWFDGSWLDNEQNFAKRRYHELYLQAQGS